jgi:UDP-GlcNAc:undecaprenyl-phosphate GlcNAc-1-phosphate transferase
VAGVSEGAWLALAFTLALAAIEAVRRSPLARRLVDRPNERSLHRVPTPRVGGLGLLAGALPAAFAFASPEGRWIAGAAALLAAVSAMDDARSLPVAVRLVTHIGAAAIAVAVVGPPAGLGTAGGLAAAGAAVVAIAWMTNLFNFMDGADGLAGGMAAIGFAALAVAAHAARAPDLAMVAASLGVASVAFLAFNFPPARVFLGDAGSVPLGFLAGAIGWQGVAREAWPAWFPLLVFSPFIVDATVTLARRLLAGEPVWRAHRSHYYQRLVLGGWSHGRLALAAWSLMACAGASALAVLGGPPMLQCGTIAAWMLAYGAIALVVDRRHPRNRGEKEERSRTQGASRAPPRETTP